MPSNLDGNVLKKRLKEVFPVCNNKRGNRYRVIKEICLPVVLFLLSMLMVIAIVITISTLPRLHRLLVYGLIHNSEIRTTSVVMVNLDMLLRLVIVALPATLVWLLIEAIPMMT